MIPNLIPMKHFYYEDNMVVRDCGISQALYKSSQDVWD